MRPPLRYVILICCDTKNSQIGPNMGEIEVFWCKNVQFSSKNEQKNEHILTFPGYQTLLKSGRKIQKCIILIFRGVFRIVRPSGAKRKFFLSPYEKYRVSCWRSPFAAFPFSNQRESERVRESEKEKKREREKEKEREREQERERERERDASKNQT